MEKFDIIKKKLCEEIDIIGRKLETGAEMSISDLEKIDKLAHALKNLIKANESESYEPHNDMSGKMSGHYYNRNGAYTGNSFADGYNRGFADARNGYMNGHSGIMYPPMYYRENDSRVW